MKLKHFDSTPPSAALIFTYVFQKIFHNRTRFMLLLLWLLRSQLCPTLCDPIEGSPPGSPISRQEHWSGLPLPSPMHESESEVAQLCPTLRDPHGL